MLGASDLSYLSVELCDDKHKVHSQEIDPFRHKLGIVMKGVTENEENWENVTEKKDHNEEQN